LMKVPDVMGAYGGCMKKIQHHLNRVAEIPAHTKKKTKKDRLQQKQERDRSLWGGLRDQRGRKRG